MNINTQPFQRRTAERGYTLMELLVVLVILGLISALVAPRVIGFLGKAKQDTAQIQIDRLDGLLDLYNLEVGGLPTEGPGAAGVDQGARWHQRLERSLCEES